MRATEIIAASAMVAAANAAPWCFWPYCYYQPAAPVATSSALQLQSTSTSCTTSSTAVKVTSSSIASSTPSTTSSTVVKVTSSSTSSAAPVSTSSSSTSSSIIPTTSSIAAITSSTSASSTFSSAAASSTSSSAASIVATTSSAAAVVPTVVASDDGYNFQSCVTEPFENGWVNVRALQGDSFHDANMTVGLCANYCSSLSFSLFGVEFSDECYCGNSVAQGASLAQSTACSMPCAGDATQECGGRGVFNLYELAGGAALNIPTVAPTYVASATATATATGSGSGSGSGSAASTAVATVVPSVGGFVYSTCAVDASGSGGVGRVLTADSTSSPTNMTVEICASYCSSYAYFGVEYGAECYCGNTINAGTTQDSTNGCNMACNGNNAELCGGSWHMNLYYNAANGGSNAVLPATYSFAATTTTSVAASTSSVVVVSTTSSSVASSSSAVVPTTSSSVASSTSMFTASAAPNTSSSSTSSVAAISTLSSALSKTTSSVVPTTMATLTRTSSAAAVSTAAPVCAPASTDLTLCPVISMNTWFGNQQFTNLHQGTGYTLNSNNPGNLMSWLFPIQTVNFDSTHTICSAAQQCMQSAGYFSTFYHSFDLHYRTDTCQWECKLQQGLFNIPSQMNQYFTVPNQNVGATCGFSS